MSFLLVIQERIDDCKHGHLERLCAVHDHTGVQINWGVYQVMVAAYRQTNRYEGPPAPAHRQTRR